MKSKQNIPLQHKTASKVLKRLSRVTPGPLKSLAKRAIGPAPSPEEPKRPDLTIIVPVYNVEEFIEETLNSLLSQTLKNWEAIVIDDGSTDRSPSIVDEYAAADSRIKALHQSNKGLGATRNVGISQASGRYLTFLDSDDIIPDNAYKFAIKKLDKTGSDFAIGATHRLRNGRQYAPSWTKIVHNQERIGTNVAEYPELMMDVIACNRVFSKKFWDEKIGLFPENVAYEDHRIMVAASIRARAIDILTATTYIWRVRESSISQSKHELKNLVDRAGAAAEALDILQAEAPAVVLDEWYTRILDTGIPLFAKHAIAADDDYKAQAQLFATKYSQLAPEATWRNVRWEQRIKVLLMAAGRWDDLAAFMLNLRLKTAGVPGTKIENGEVELDTSGWVRDLSSCLGTRTALGTRLTPLNARIHQVNWTDSGLHLAGFAYISNVVTSFDDELTARLVSKNGAQVHDLAALRKVENQHASRFANHTYFEYSESGFVLDIPWSVFIDVISSDGYDETATWRIEFTRTSGSISRSVLADNYFRNGSGAAFTQQAVPAHFNSVVLLRDSNTFSLRVKTIKYALTTLKTESEYVSGTVQVSPHAGPPPTQIHWAKSAKKLDPDSASARLDPTENTGEFAFSGLHLAEGQKVRLNAKAHNATSTPVAWALSEDEYHVHDSVVANKTPFGFIDFTNGIERAVAQSVKFENNAVDIEIRTNPPEATEISASIESDSTQERIYGHVTFSEEQRLNIHFDLDIVTPSCGPLQGDYSVLVNDTQVVPEIQTAMEMPKSHISSFYRVEAIRGTVTEGRPLKLKFRPPLTDHESGAWNQKQLREWYRQSNFEPEEAVLFQCYRGETASDNQLAIYRELAQVLPELKCYWGVSDGSVVTPEGATPLIIGSKEWYRVLGSARYLCNNIEFDAFFARRPHQKFLQTFHGHAFKSMGKTFWRTKDYGPTEVAFECTRRKNAWTSALMPNEESIQYYKSEYDYYGNYLVAGLPRNDYLVNADPQVARRSVASAYGIHDFSSKWVLYAPTWREATATSAWSAKMFDQLDVDLLADSLGEGWTIMVRGHGYNSRENERIERSASVIDVTDYPEVNDLILSCDASILDYSSLRFDWAITRKPMIFFVPDMEEYFDLRPALFSFEESAPGPLTTTTAQVVDELKRVDSYETRFSEPLDIFNRRFNSLSDGHATQRVVDSFFKEVL